MNGVPDASRRHGCYLSKGVSCIMPPMRLFLLFLGLVAVMVTPMLIFGDRFDTLLGGQGSVELMRRYGAWAWAVGVLLICSDLILPVPASSVMAALGIVYGPVLGGIVGGAGSSLAGLIAYGLCRALGDRAANRLVGAKDLMRTRAFFDHRGGWAVALTRPAPLLPEVICCLAGLGRMKAGRFLAALACGSFPLGFTFATLGHYGADRPTLAIVVSAVIPLALWPFVRRAFQA